MINWGLFMELQSNLKHCPDNRAVWIQLLTRRVVFHDNKISSIEQISLHWWLLHVCGLILVSFCLKVLGFDENVLGNQHTWARKYHKLQNSRCHSIALRLWYFPPEISEIWGDNGGNSVHIHEQRCKQTGTQMYYWLWGGQQIFHWPYPGMDTDLPSRQTPLFAWKADPLVMWSVMHAGKRQTCSPWTDKKRVKTLPSPTSRLVNMNNYMLLAGFPPIREIRENRENFENFFQSRKSGKNRGFSAKIREKIFKSGKFSNSW